MCVRTFFRRPGDWRWRSRAARPVGPPGWLAARCSSPCCMARSARTAMPVVGWIMPGWQYTLADTSRSLRTRQRLGRSRDHQVDNGYAAGPVVGLRQLGSHIGYRMMPPAGCHYPQWAAPRTRSGLSARLWRRASAGSEGRAALSKLRHCWQESAARGLLRQRRRCAYQLGPEPAGSGPTLVN